MLNPRLVQALAAQLLPRYGSAGAIFVGAGLKMYQFRRFENAANSPV
jgi:hypothetical protein